MATILVIEDEEDIRLNVSELLTLVKHKVFMAANGKEGIEIAQREHPDLIISDVMMPYIDGFGLLHILKKDRNTRNIPFVFLTSKSDINNLRQAMKLGANDYIVKPFEGSELLATVEARLKAANDQRTEEQEYTYTAPITEPIVTSKIECVKDPLAELVANCDVIDFSKKQIIYKEGSIPRFLYFINKGKVRTFKNHEDGKYLVMGLYGEKDFIGYAPLLEGVFHAETAEVIEDTEVVMIPKSKFEALINTHPEVMKHFMTMLAKNLMEKEEQLLGATYNTLRKKVASALIALGKKYSRNSDNKHTINMSRDELASIAGTATESLIRTLTEFKQEKLVEVENGMITIIDLQKLQRLVR